MPKKPTYKRKIKNILIHRPLQREYTLLMIGIMMVSALCVSFVIHITIRQAFLGGPYRIGTVSPYEILSYVNQALVVRVSFTLFVCVMISTVIGISFLHKVAGPVYRFRMTLEKMAKGEIPNDVKLRTKDYFKEVADEFNKVFVVMRERRDRSHQVAGMLDQLSGNAELPENVRQSLREAKDSLTKS